jgi:hypothetical protein
MKVSELIMLLEQCDQNAVVNFVSDEHNFLDIEFVENRLRSPNGWDAVVSLYEEKPNWRESEDYEVEEISGDYVFGVTKYHDIGSKWREPIGRMDDQN